VEALLHHRDFTGLLRHHSHRLSSHINWVITLVGRRLRITTNITISCSNHPLLRSTAVGTVTIGTLKETAHRTRSSQAAHSRVATVRSSSSNKEGDTTVQATTTAAATKPTPVAADTTTTNTTTTRCSNPHTRFHHPQERCPVNSSTTTSTITNICYITCQAARRTALVPR
jgi:hypothetical protein